MSNEESNADDDATKATFHEVFFGVPGGVLIGDDGNPRVVGGKDHLEPKAQPLDEEIHVCGQIVGGKADLGKGLGELAEVPGRIADRGRRPRRHAMPLKTMCMWSASLRRRLGTKPWCRK